MKPTIPTGQNTFCGPFALAMALGCTTDRAARVISRARLDRRATVRGVYHWELDGALTRYGLPCLELTPPDSGHYEEAPMSEGRISRWVPRRREALTLSRWLKRYGTAYGDRLAIVNVTGHFVCVYRGLLADNGTRAWVEPARFRGRRSRVVRWYVVTPRRRRPRKATPAEGTSAARAITLL